jgi:hypothetical protein
MQARLGISKRAHRCFATELSSRETELTGGLLVLLLLLLLLQGIQISKETQAEIEQICSFSFEQCL